MSEDKESTRLETRRPDASDEVFSEDAQIRWRRDWDALMIGFWLGVMSTLGALWIWG